jgi:hypothetical protein
MQLSGQQSACFECARFGPSSLLENIASAAIRDYMYNNLHQLWNFLICAQDY